MHLFFIFYLIYIYHHLFSSYFFYVFYLIFYDSINIILEDDNGSEIDINNHWSITLEFNKVINDNILNIDKSQINPNVADVINNDIVGGNQK